MKGVLLALLALVASCTEDTKSAAPGSAGAAASATSPADEVEEICARAERSRAPSAEVRALLSSKEVATRARAALAAGRIADEKAIPALTSMLAWSGADGSVAAWALGRMPARVAEAPANSAAPANAASANAASPANAASLANTAAVTKPADGEAVLAACVQTQCAEAAEAARALGAAQRTAATLAILAKALEGPAPIATEAGLTLAKLARVGGKGADAQIAEAARAQLWKALARTESSVRFAAAAALGRIPRADPKAALDVVASVPLILAMKDPEGETRAAAARAAGKQGLAAAAIVQLFKDSDWRVRVEAARALATAPGGGELVASMIREAAAQLAAEKDLAGARWAHPLVALLESAATLKRPRAELPVPESLSAPTAAATVAVRCAAAEARDRIAGDLLETPSCAGALEPAWRTRFRTANLAVDLAGDHRDGGPGRALIAALNDTDPRVRSAAAGASPVFAAELIERLDDPDAFVVGSAAGSLSKDAAVARAALPAAARAAWRFSSARGDATGSPRADALAALAALYTAAVTLPPDFAALKPLFSLEGAPPVASLPLFHALVDLQPIMTPDKPKSALQPLPPAIPHQAEAGLPGHGPRARTLVLTTTAGDLRARLLIAGDEAPLTSAALASLANQGFYDGTFWHRVVPDFVAQGGDPLGDGEGGPGWALPDEHTPLHFRRGTLGIATSGPETGGSQIFFCHSAQPHLDGRYTIAGELESDAKGFLALDALQVGDLILHARAE